MEDFRKQVNLWFSRETTNLWEHTLHVFFKSVFFLNKIQGLEKNLVRVTFNGNPTHLFQDYLRVYLDIRLCEDGLSFKFSHFGLGVEFRGEFSNVPVSAFRNHPDQLMAALHQVQNP